MRQYCQQDMDLLPKLKRRRTQRRIYVSPHWLRSSAQWTGKQKLLCPVRALREYISRTKQIRRSQQAFFVCYKKGQHHKQATKASLARWVKDAIEFAENKRSDKPSTSKISAHIRQLRGISHTLAFEAGASLEHVCKQAIGKVLIPFYPII